MTSKHDRHVAILLQQPHLLSLDDIILSLAHLNYYNSRRQLGEVDLVFITSRPYRHSRVHIVEYKCSDAHRDHAIIQLMHSQLFLSTLLNTHVNKYYVHSNSPYVVEFI